jgi:hypothetical protein
MSTIRFGTILSAFAALVAAATIATAQQANLNLEGFVRDAAT